MSHKEQILDALGVAVVAIDPSGCICFANAAAVQLFGRSPTEFTALPMTELVPEWSGVCQAQRNGQADHHRLSTLACGLHKSGADLSLILHHTPWNTEAATQGSILCLLEADSELADDQLDRAEFQRIKHAVMGSRIGIFEVDMIKGTSTVSGAWRELMDIGSDEDGDTQAIWRSRIHPDDLPLVEQADRDCIEGRSDRSLMDYRIQDRAGSGWRWMRSDAVANSRDAHGIATRLIGTQTDITDSKTSAAALQKSEEMFRLAMEHAPIGKALVAPDGRWLAVNPALCRFLGYTEVELLTTDFQAITHPDDLEKDVDHVKRLLAGEDKTYSMEKRYIRPDGEVVWGHLSVALIRDDHGVPVHFISQILDISKQRRLEKMKRDFTATVSHELRTPVTAIAAALELIVSDTGNSFSEKDRRLLSISRDACRHLRRILDDILDFQKVSSNQMQISAARTEVVEIARQAIRGAQPLAEQYGVTLVLDAQVSETFCTVDPVRIQQVLANLLSNAVKFSPDGGRVTVRVGVDGNQVRMSVADQGAGIPEGFHDRIFTPFAQVDASGARDRQGTGLGLSISKQLVERMGGAIGFTSAKQSGTVFWITFPADSGQDQRKTTAAN